VYGGEEGTKRNLGNANYFHVPMKMSQRLLHHNANKKPFEKKCEKHLILDSIESQKKHRLNVITRMFGFDLNNKRRN